ncbi:MAG: SulP family inorganic anion transporter [Gammaproteobacteria bacterium]|jgi:SulP family sulfate permease|nr:SulP family inorganic anion transporter [Gammaproteobacteria bacterium]
MIRSKNYRGDFFGGITTAVVALPLALAFGVSSGAGALAGLYGAIFAGAFAAVCGGTRVQITGPTGPMTVVMALIVIHFEGDLPAAFAVVILAGLLQILFGKFGIGRYIKLVPQPVVSGFMSGIGIIIIILQLPALFGVVGFEGSTLTILSAIPQMAMSLDINALLLGLAVIGIMFFTPAKINRYFPTPLLALLIGSSLAVVLSLDIAQIGAVPTGVPQFGIPSFSLDELPYVIRFALVLAFLGSIDSLLTSIVADSLTRSTHDSNRELIGQGIGNIASGLFSGLPGAGATMRTLINVRAGGSTPLSGVIHSLLLLLIVLGFGRTVSHIPLAVLAGILFKVGIDIIDWNYLRRLFSAPRAGVVIMMSTLLLTVLVDLITAFAVGFIMASVLFVARMADAQINNARFAFGADQLENLTPEEAEILEHGAGRIVLFHVEGPLSFGSAREVARLLQSTIEKDVLAIDLRDVPFIDSSACAALDEVIQRLNDDGDQVLLFGARQRVKDILQQTGVVERLGAENLLEQRIDALRMAGSIIERNLAVAD